MPEKEGNWAALFLVFSLLPIWRTGLRDKQTLWEFLYEHTVWGHKVEYIPKEQYK